MMVRQLLNAFGKLGLSTYINSGKSYDDPLSLYN